MPLTSEPTEETLRILQLFRWFRGGTGSAFSQVEFSMCRLLACMRKKAEFSSGLQALPWTPSDRSKAFRSTFVGSALLQQHVSRASEICDTFDLIIVPRYFLAHGFARIDMPARVIQMRKFQPASGNTWNEEQWDIPFEKMEVGGIRSIASRKLPSSCASKLAKSTI